MTTLYFILALLAAICFTVAASVRAVAPLRVQLLALGLLLWVLIPVLQYGRVVF